MTFDGSKLWDEIHTRAMRVSTPQELYYYSQWLRQVSQTLPCGKCRNHAIKWLAENPPEECPNAFYHSWLYHNATNEATGKPPVSYEQAYNRYA